MEFTQEKENGIIQKPDISWNSSSLMWNKQKKPF